MPNNKNSSDKKKLPSPILVPIDFSAHARAAVRQACVLADCLKAPLIIIHVVHDPEDMPGYFARMAKKKHLTRMEDIAEEMLDEFIAGLRKEMPESQSLKKAEKALVLGVPVPRILEVAKKTNSCMIVMGSKGLTGLKHIMLGSKATQLVQLSPIPVTIVKANQKD